MIAVVVVDDLRRREGLHLLDLDRLRRHGASTFRALVSDCTITLEVVARFLGLLELYREGSVAFDQAAALAELRVRWTGSGDDEAVEDSPDTDEDYG